MQYFVAGATGFIGKRRVKRLMERKGVVVHFLIRKKSENKVAGLREFWASAPHARRRCVSPCGSVSPDR